MKASQFTDYTPKNIGNFEMKRKSANGRNNNDVTQ
jgi:hypothetical protein